MRTLLDISKGNLKQVELNFRNITSDEVQLNIIGYHLQQTAELYLKYSLEKNGIKYEKIHDIKVLYNLCKKNNISVDNRLRLYADTLTLWESRTRYVKNYTADYDDLVEVYHILSDIVDSNITKEF